MNTETTGDTGLVTACQKGDEKACRTLFQEYRDMVASLCYKFLGSGYDVQEMAQKIFIEVFKSLAAFKGNASLKTWVYRISANICFKEIRRRKLDRRLFTDFSPEAANVRDESLPGNPLRQMESAELQGQVRRALDSLDKKKRLVLVLHDMEGCTLDEIAGIVGSSTGTVKSRLFYARREMVKKLKQWRSVA